MSITRELRDEFNQDYKICKKVKKFADQIDEAHEKALSEAREGWIELPKDSDGTLVHPNDTIRIPSGELIKCEDSLVYLMTDQNWYFDVCGEKIRVSECFVTNKPYDKNGKAIELGAYVVFSNQSPVKVERIDTRVDGFKIWGILDNGDEDYWYWYKPPD